MKKEEAIKHLKWRFTESGINASKKDIESINSLILDLKKDEQETLNNDILFCKLFLWSFKNEIIRSAEANKYAYVDYFLILDKYKSILNIDAKSHLSSLEDEIKSIDMQVLINKDNLNTATLIALNNKKTSKLIRETLLQFIKNNKWN